VTFPNGDLQALTGALASLLSSPERLAQYRAGARSHLARHRKADVARAYLQVFEAARNGKRVASKMKESVQGR
jgi:glycosyltransferase involved in cell wall biosynthesis